MRFRNSKRVSALMLASLMVVFLIPGTASGDLPGQDHSVDFKGKIFQRVWVNYTVTDTAQEFILDVADGHFLDAGEKGRGDPGQVVEFRGFYGGTDCESWNLTGGVRFDSDFPFDPDTGSLNVEVPVVADHQVREPESPCAWEDAPPTHEHFSGSVFVALAPVETCPKKGPKKGCNQSNPIPDTFTVVLDGTTPFDGPWTSEDFQQSWRSDRSHNGPYRWTETTP